MYCLSLLRCQFIWFGCGEICVARLRGTRAGLDRLIGWCVECGIGWETLGQRWTSEVTGLSMSDDVLHVFEHELLPQGHIRVGRNHLDEATAARLLFRVCCRRQLFVSWSFGVVTLGV